MIVVLMGVSGAGKTAVGARLAARLDWPFLDADDLHPSGNIRKMAAGEPLTDADRAPWLQRVRAVMDEHAAADRSLIVACSALKRDYRDRLRGGRGDVRFMHLEVGRPELERRLRGRSSHFFDPDLLESQLETLERPETATIVDADRDLDALVEALERTVRGVAAGTGPSGRSPRKKRGGR